MSVGRGLPSSAALGFFEALAEGPASLPDLARAASIITDVNQGELYGTGRRNEAVRARWIVMCLAVHRRGLSYSRVAQFLRRDHTTIIHGSNGAIRLITKDPAFAKRVTDTWNLACAGKTAMSRAEQDNKARQAEIVSAAEIAELRKTVKHELGKTASGNERESGCWTRTQLAEMDRRFRVALTAFGKGMTYEVPR